MSQVWGLVFKAMSPRPFWKLRPLPIIKAERARTKAVYLKVWQNTEMILDINYDELH